MTSPKLTFRSPDLLETRGENHLMVWGDLGVWLVVDGELRSLLEQFDGSIDLDTVFSRHAGRWGGTVEKVTLEATPLVGDFLNRGVLYRGVFAPGPQEEPLSIANVTFNITNRCNLRCPFCYNWERKGDEVSVDDVVAFLQAGTKTLSRESSLIILGGEPLLVPDRLFAIVEQTADLFTRPVMISTNGTRLDDAMVARLAAAGIEVQISLDSADQSTHDKGRGKGVYAKAVAGARRLVAAGVHTILSMVVQKSTVEELEGFLALAHGLGVNEARFIPLRNVGAAAQKGVTPDLPDPLVTFEHLLKVLEKRPEYSRLLERDYFSIAAHQCRFSALRVSCGIGRRVIFIDADGTLYPCPNHASDLFRLGDIRNDSLKDVLLNGEPMKQLRQQYHVDKYSKCADCPFKRWCAGDCRGEVRDTFDDPLAPSPHCESLKKMYTKILWRLALGDEKVGGILKGPSAHTAQNTFL